MENNNKRTVKVNMELKGDMDTAGANFTGAVIAVGIALSAVISGSALLLHVIRWW